MKVNELKHQAKLQEWRDHILECRSSGCAVSKWCAEHHVHPTTYYKWERELFGGVGKDLVLSEQQTISLPVFAELPVPQEKMNPQRSQMVSATIHINGIAVDVYSNIEPSTLTALLQLLKSC